MNGNLGKEEKREKEREREILPNIRNFLFSPFFFLVSSSVLQNNSKTFRYVSANSAKYSTSNGTVNET